MNILVIRNDNIGDLFFSTFIFRELKKLYPNCSISLVVSPESKSLVEKNPYIDEIIELPTAGYAFKSIIDYFKCGSILKKKNFDVGIDLRGSPMNSGFLLWYANIPKRIGKQDASESKLKQWVMGKLLNFPIFTYHHTSNTHLVKENLLIVNQGMDTNIIDWTPEIHTTREDQILVDNVLDTINIGKSICLLPCANGEYKQWSMENWKQVIKYIASFNMDVILLGSKKEERTLIELSNEVGYNHCHIWVGLNLRSLSLLFKDSSLNIGSDSGALHIAAASGTPTIVLSPSEPAIFKNGKFLPLGDSKMVWANGAEMDTIKIEDVKEAIKVMI